MAKGATDTSISDTAARDFLRTAQDRAKLQCERVAGFHMIKTGQAGSWRYRYTDDLGKQRSATIGRYPAMKAAEAAAIALSWRNQRADPLAEKTQRRKQAKTAEQIATARKLADYIDGIYTSHQSRKKNAGKHTIDLIRGNFTDLLDRDMATLCAADVKAWQAKREKAGRVHSTLQRGYGALKTMLRHAVKEGVLEVNPLAGVQLAPPSAAEKSKSLSAEAAAHRRMLTTGELAGIQTGLDAFAEELRQQRRSSRKHGKPDLPDLDAVTFAHWFIPFCQLSLHTGMRPGDLYALTWRELNLPFRRLLKTLEKTQHHANPAKVDMPLNDEIMAVMTAWHVQQGKQDSGLVFPSTVTGEQMDKKAHGRAWARVLKLGNLPDLDFYSLRHHFISALVAAGAPMLAVAKLAGHKSTKMIEEHYGHLAKNTAADLLEQYAAGLKAKPEQSVTAA